MSLKNIPQVIKERVQQYKEKTALRVKDENTGKYKSYSWIELEEKVNFVAAALISIGIKKGDRVSIYSQNVPEWSICDIGILSAGAVTVPLYATDAVSQAEYIINDAEVSVIFVGEQSQYDTALSIQKKLPILKYIIALDPAIKISAPHSYHFYEFLNIGKDHLQQVNDRIEQIEPDDLATLIYTSGTTGEPKGVMLVHGNFLHSFIIHDKRLIASEKDVSMSFLPLSHIFERAWTFYALHKGMEIVYLKDPKKVLEALKEVSPTIMCSVPRLYEKIYVAIHKNVETASPIKKKIFNWAVEIGKQRLNFTINERPVPVFVQIQYRLAEKLVFNKMRSLLGGKVRFFPCAGAPLLDKINQFFHAAGIPLKYGYGLSETTASVSCFTNHHFKFGTIGKPMPDVEVKIGNNNEIMVKGASVMKGYYKNEKATEEVMEDGWFKTGDAGSIDEEGNLIFTERIKELMKTSVGKYIAPQYIESTIGRDPYIEQLMVIGDNKHYVTALIVPAFQELELYAKEHNISFSDREDLINNPEVIKLYEGRIALQQEELAFYEKVKKFKLLSKEFSIDKGDITPTLKIKRKSITKKYEQLIEEMYEEENV